MRVVAFPSSMLPVCMSALPSTTTATVFLIASSNSSSSVGACPGLTTCLILIGSCLALLPTALFVFLWVRYAQGPSAIWKCVPRGLSTSQSKTTKGAAEIAVGESRAIHKNDGEVGDDADSGRGGPVSSPLYGMLERVRRHVSVVTMRRWMWKSVESDIMTTAPQGGPPPSFTLDNIVDVCVSEQVEEARRNNNTINHLEGRPPLSAFTLEQHQHERRGVLRHASVVLLEYRVLSYAAADSAGLLLLSVWTRRTQLCASPPLPLLPFFLRHSLLLSWRYDHSRHCFLLSTALRHLR